MKIHAAACLAATLMVGLNGCAAPPATTRGQSVQQTGHHMVNTVPNRTGNVSSVQNYFHDKHDFASNASYHSTTGFPGYSGFACQQGGCPSGACGPGGCGPAGCGDPHCGCGCIGNPHHYHSYSYERPLTQNMTYPDPNAFGGAVVYPYYTHKGPSDFFRDDCCDR